MGFEVKQKSDTYKILRFWNERIGGEWHNEEIATIIREDDWFSIQLTGEWEIEDNYMYIAVERLLLHVLTAYYFGDEDKVKKALEFLDVKDPVFKDINSEEVE